MLKMHHRLFAVIEFVLCACAGVLPGFSQRCFLCGKAVRGNRVTNLHGLFFKKTQNSHLSIALIMKKKVNFKT